jgi:hypothetical protein
MKAFSSTLLFLSLAAPLSVLTTAHTQAASSKDFLSDPEVREFAQRLCSRIETANIDGENIVKNIEDQC